MNTDMIIHVFLGLLLLAIPVGRSYDSTTARALSDSMGIDQSQQSLALDNLVGGDVCCIGMAGAETLRT